MKYQEIKTIEDACKAVGTSVAEMEKGFKSLPEKYRKPLLSHALLVVAAEAINEGWQPNWADTGQYKYHLWPDIEKDTGKPSGFGLSSCDYAYWFAVAVVGSRLCFKDRDRARYCFDTFRQLWEDYFLIDK